MLARVINLGLLVAVAITIPLSHHALSQKKGKGPAPKVPICHFPDESETGHVINVSANAVPAHLSKHGDCEEPFSIDPATGACICPTCEDRCDIAFEECIAEGGTTEECEAARSECLTGCFVACEQDCLSEFEACLAAGTPQAECEAARTECLTACSNPAGG